MRRDPLFERLWNGSAPMEEWTRAVSHGAVTAVADNIISVHTTYLCGSVTAIRSSAGLVLIDTAKPDTAAMTLAAIRRWNDAAGSRRASWPYRRHRRHQGHRRGGRRERHPQAACCRARERVAPNAPL
jgi:hypothetical protein